MSGFRLEIQMSEAEWQSLSIADRKRLQDIVDGVYEPPRHSAVGVFEEYQGEARDREVDHRGFSLNQTSDAQ